MKNNVSLRDLYAFGAKLPIDLSLSENPLGCSPNVLNLFSSVTQRDVFDYPDPDSTELKNALSSALRVKNENIFISNGSESIIKLLPQAFMNVGERALVPAVTFPLFEKAVQINGNKVEFAAMGTQLDIDLSALEEKLTDTIKLIFITNPNNPTGKILSKAELVAFIRSTQALVIVDEANIEFGGESVVSELSKLPNLIILRTFSKAFGLAGLRIGFALGSKNIIRTLESCGQPFPVSTLAQKAATLALQDRAFMKKTKRFMDKQRTLLTSQLRFRGFEVIKSSANNLLVRVDSCFSNSDECVKLLNEKGVSVVNGTSFRGLGTSFIRVSPRTEKINKQFLTKLDEILLER